MNNSSDQYEKVLLENVSGSAKRGEFVGIMGSSGSGKSTLLDCLSLRNKRYQGEIYFDDNLVDSNYQNLSMPTLLVILSTN